MKKLLLIIPTLIFLTSLFGFSTTTNAQASPAYTFQINPETKLKYTITPGSTIKDYITITNLDKNRWIDIKVKALNMPERWVRIDQEATRIENQSSKNINFSIYIPSNAETQSLEGILTFQLVNFEGHNSTNKNFSIALGIGNNITINIIEGEISNQNYSKENSTLDTIKNSISSSTIRQKTTPIITYIYTLIEDNINFVLLLIIISLILKLALVKKNIQTTQNKNNKTKKILQKTKTAKRKK